MSAYVIFDVEIFDLTRYQEFMVGVKPALEAAGGKYLARAGEHRVYEGDWEPRRIVILEFPDIAAFESFYNGPVVKTFKRGNVGKFQNDNAPRLPVAFVNTVLASTRQVLATCSL